MENGVGIRTPRQAIWLLSVLVEWGAIYILISVSSSLVPTHRLLLFSLGHDLSYSCHTPGLRSRKAW